MRYSREDVQTHSDRGPSLPAVNVKVYTTIEQAWPAFQRDARPDEGFTLEWIYENVGDSMMSAVWQMCCEWEYEYFEGWATGSDKAGDSIFPDDNITLEVQGRSGGWIAVNGLPDIEEWDAVRIARWGKFERIARGLADDIPYQVLSNLYSNEYESARDEAIEAARAAREDIATLERTP